MPIYEYQCKECDHKFEKLQKISDEPLKDCPNCHRPSLVKLVSAAGFQLKGTGWYVTDFKDKAKPSQSKSSKDNNTAGGAAGADNKRSSSTSETKPGKSTDQSSTQ